MNEKESNASNASTPLQTVLKVLRNVTIERAQKSRTNKLQKKKLDGEEEEEANIKIHTHLFNTLRSCLKSGCYGEAYEIFKFLVDHAQCSRNFIWKMLMIFTEKHKNSLQLVSNMANHFLQLKAGFASEVQLVRLITLVKQGLYSKASFETPEEAKRLMFSANSASYPAIGISLLLTGYHTLLQYQNVEDGDSTMLEGMAKSFQELFKCKAFYPLFIEAYTLVLLKLGQDEDVRQLLYSYVDLESKCNAGVLGAVHAFNIVKLHMRDGAGVKLLFHLLENIAERSPGHPRVLDLCRLLLDKRSVRSGKKNTELYTDAESGESEDDTKRLDYKKACVDKSLKLMFDFLDTYAYREPSDIVKQAWGLMADILRRVFTDEMAFLHTIANYWHKSRKHWWPFFQVKKNTSIKPGDATLLSNQAFVCYVFEEEEHPFVQSVLSLSTSSLLSSLIRQLRDHKSIFDEKMQRILLRNPPEKHVRLQSKPKKPINSTSTIQNEETVAYETLKHIDSAELASEYLEFRCRTKSIRPKNDYLTIAFTTPAIENLLSLPIEDLVRKRFERRRRLPPRKPIVNPPLTVLQPSDSEDSENAEPDDFWNTDQSEISRNGWLGRLRKHGALKEDAPDPDGEELFVPKKAPVPQEVKMKAQRWNRFLGSGRWKSTNEKKSKISQIVDDCVQTMDSKDACESTATLSKGKKGKLSSSVKSTGVKRVRKLSLDTSPESKSNTTSKKKAKITFPELTSSGRQEFVEMEPSQSPTPMSGLSDGSLSRTVFSKVQPNKRTTQEGEVLSSCSLSLVLELESSQKVSYKEITTKISESHSSKSKTVKANNAPQITSNTINKDSKTATSFSSEISQRKMKTCADEKQGNNNESFDLLKCRRNSVQQTPTKTQMTMPFLNSVSKSVSSHGESEIEIPDRICAATPPSVHELSKPIANSKGKLMKVCVTPRKGEIVATREVFKLTQPTTGLKDSQTSKSSAKNKQSKALYGWTVTSTVTSINQLQ